MPVGVTMSGWTANSSIKTRGSSDRGGSSVAGASPVAMSATRNKVEKHGVSLEVRSVTLRGLLVEAARRRFPMVMHWRLDGGIVDLA